MKIVLARQEMHKRWMDVEILADTARYKIKFLTRQISTFSWWNRHEIAYSDKFNLCVWRIG